MAPPRLHAQFDIVVLTSVSVALDRE